MLRRKKKVDSPPAPAEPQCDLQSPVGGITTWAQALIAALAETLTPYELGVLRVQADALERRPRVTPLPADPTTPTIVRDHTSLGELASKIATADDVVVDLETSSLDPRKGVIVGVGLAVADQTFYIPLNHRFDGDGDLRPNQLPLAEVLQVLQLQARPLINHNTKFELRWLRQHGRIECNFVWDTMLAARLLRADQSAELKVVAARELDVPDWSLPTSDMERLEFMPIDTVAAYNAKDTWYTLRLYRKQAKCLV
jgi:DNA polymerase I-like protein with 3'-5' exonuclease and polymerase domains